MGIKATEQVAVVTGGARGIGRRFVGGLREVGMTVVSVDLDEAAQAEAWGEVPEVTTVSGDVTEDGFLDGVAARAVARHGRLDHWVNSAGIFSAESAFDRDVEVWQRTLDVNVRGVFLGARAAARQMRGEGGSVVNMASVGGLLALANMSDYCASKAAVEHLTRALAIEWGPEGVRVNAISPGFIDTRMLAWMRDDPEQRAKQMERVPLGRIGTTDDVLGALLYLASDAASYVTGTTLVVDGGLACG